MSEDSRTYDFAVAGGGIVGLATARALAAGGERRVVVLEAEREVGSHQSGRNSGVVHSGLYYKPGSFKARLCVEGRLALERYCADRGVAYERCGKLVVATRADELPRLDELERRGRANGLTGVRRLPAEAIREHEPHAAGLAALHVPETGIVDFPAMCRALAADLAAAGGAVLAGRAVTGAVRDGASLVVRTAAGEVRARALVGCAGLHADRVARACGVEPQVRIVPFRGEYHLLAPARRALVRHLIYPVPDPRFPFLGVHFTRRVSGEIEAGPNAVLALARHGYSWGAVSVRDLAETFAWPGFWRLASRHAAHALGEVHRSLDRRAFAQALRRLVPELRDDDLAPARAGVRAQALARDGSLVDDFHVVRGERQLHVLNAPSPAATASLAIGEWIAAQAGELVG
jgi:(S)-2-hydroxyglutarate dehydrogenase